MQAASEIAQAWPLIEAQHLDVAINAAREEGPGISIFRLLKSPKEGGVNCEYMFAGKGGKGWDIFTQSSSEWTQLETIYDPDKHALIGLHVVNEDGISTGQNRLYDMDTRKEV